MGRIALIGALLLLTIIQIAATSGSDIKIPKGVNLYDLHVEGDSIVKSDTIKDSTLIRKITLIDSLAKPILGQEPVDFRMFSRARPIKYVPVVDSSKVKKKKRKK